MAEIERMYENCNFEKSMGVGSPLALHPFTAGKQLELIKFLGSLKDYTVETDKFKGVYYVGCREAGSNNKHWGSHNLFEEALAELVNDLWQSLTDQEKEEIRRILE